MKNNKIFIFVILFVAISILPINADEYIIQSGHVNSITDFKWLKSEQLFFTADNGGEIKIWDVLTYNLVKNLRISHLPLSGIEVHPRKSILAILIKTADAYELKVINWRTGETLYSKNIKERPLEIKFSPRGNYLVLTQSEWRSLLVLNASSGKELKYLNKSFGIVSYFSISASEKTIMVYAPSGKLTYIDFRTAREKLEKPLETLSNLSHLQISKNQLFLVCTDGERLLAIDLLTGGKITEIPVKNIKKINISEDDKEISVIASNGRKDQVLFYKFDGKSFSLKSNKLEKKQITQALYANRKFYFSDHQGRMLFSDAFGRETVFSQNNLIPVSDLAISKSKIAIGNAQQIIIFSSDLLQPRSRSQGELKIKYTVFENPLKVAVGLEFLRNSKLFIWSKDASLHQFVNLNLRTGEIASEYDEFESPLIQLDILDDSILTLQKNGTCKILDSLTFETNFEYDAPGMHKINYVTKNTLIGARSKLSQLGSPLLKINPETGETVPISDSSLLCYDIAYDNSSQRLYSLSIKEKNNNTETMLRRHYGRNFEKEKVIHRYSGEDLFSSLTLDPKGRYLFTTIGYDITEWNGINAVSYTRSDHIPRNLYVSKEILLSLNRDLSISVWNRKKRSKSLDLYFFKDQSWVAITATGSYLNSKGGEKYLYKSNF